MSRAWILLVLLVASCGRDAEATGSSHDAGTPNGPMSVDVVPVVSRPLDTAVHLEGELYAYQSVAEFPRVNGFVAEIPVDRGSVVHRGQLLVRLVAPELAAQRAEALARMQSDQTTYDRLRTAAQTPGVIAGNDVDVAAATSRSARERVRALTDVESYLVVRAPFDGVVTERNVHPGALVGPVPSAANAVPMVRVEQLATLRLTVAVPEMYVGEITEGASATFEVRAWPQRTFTGTIRRLAHSLDVRTRTMPVELDVDNPTGDLAPGMFADVLWPVRRSTPSLFVPSRAIVQNAERTFVVRVRNGIVGQVPVRRGMTVGDVVEISGDLVPGDLIARRGSEDLRVGTHVVAHVVAADAGLSGR